MGPIHPVWALAAIHPWWGYWYAPATTASCDLWETYILVCDGNSSCLDVIVRSKFLIIPARPQPVLICVGHVFDLHSSLKGRF